MAVQQGSNYFGGLLYLARIAMIMLQFGSRDPRCNLLKLPACVRFLACDPLFRNRGGHLWYRTCCQKNIVRVINDKITEHSKYRVTLVVAHLGWVDFDFSHSTVCPILLGQMGIWQNWLYSWAKWWNIQNLS